jgi:hypothetical protein
MLVCELFGVMPVSLERKKWSKKVQGKPERSARFALPTHNNTPLLSSSFF